MNFEYDSNKSAENKAKHGIDFEEAQALWDDPDAIELCTAFTKEVRYIVIGMIGQKHWSAVITYRKKNIRLISVRRSRDKEVEVYEEKINNR